MIPARCRLPHPQDAILDFFGVSVKAADLLATCSHMRLLAKKVAAVREPAVTNFKLDANSCLSVPKWGKVSQEGRLGRDGQVQGAYTPPRVRVFS